MSHTEPNKPDPLVLLARTSAAKRSRRILPGLILLAVVAGLVGLFGWWVWPRGDYPAVTLAAFDQVALPEEKITITACLEPVEPFEQDAHLAGAALYFLAGAADAREAAADARGFASWDHALGTESPVLDFVVRYPGLPTHRRGVPASGRVFVWPAETSLLVVDADSALTQGSADALWTANNLDIRALPGAAATLRAAAKTRRIVFLSAGADRPTRYNKLRAWLTSGARPAAESFPPGPVLAAGSVPSEGRGRFLDETLVELRRRFPDSGTAVTQDERLAELLRDSGFTTFLLTQTEPPAGVESVKSWGELQKVLTP